MYIIITSKVCIHQFLILYIALFNINNSLKYFVVFESSQRMMLLGQETEMASPESLFVFVVANRSHISKTTPIHHRVLKYEGCSLHHKPCWFLSRCSVYGCGKCHRMSCLIYVKQHKNKPQTKVMRSKLDFLATTINSILADERWWKMHPSYFEMILWLINVWPCHWPQQNK